MPQWDFLNFLAEKAGEYPRFRLLMSTEVTSLRWNNERVVGVNARQGDRDLVLEADLVIGADGRNSIVRKAAGLDVESFGTATDLLWMKVSKEAGDPQQAMGHAGPRQGLVLIDRGDYWQCGYVITKGTVDTLKAEGLGALRARIAEVAPLPRDRFEEIRSWDDVHLLSVRIDRLKTWWKPGVLCIGDAAHAMSPIGGVGVNLAVESRFSQAIPPADAPLRPGANATPPPNPPPAPQQVSRRLPPSPQQDTDPPPHPEPEQAVGSAPPRSRSLNTQDWSWSTYRYAAARQIISSPLNKVDT